MASIEVAGIDAEQRMTVTAQVLQGALAEVLRSGPQPALRIGPWPAAEPALRDGLEQTYRSLASMSEDRAERVALVDAANAVRRWTMR